MVNKLTSTKNKGTIRKKTEMNKIQQAINKSSVDFLYASTLYFSQCYYFTYYVLQYMQPFLLVGYYNYTELNTINYTNTKQAMAAVVTKITPAKFAIEMVLI